LSFLVVSAGRRVRYRLIPSRTPQSVFPIPLTGKIQPYHRHLLTASLRASGLCSFVSLG
jgi:hypothetical protein